jgi:hypothetical protein
MGARDVEERYEHPGHDRVDPILVVSAERRLDAGRQLDPDHIRSGL